MWAQTLVSALPRLPAPHNLKGSSVVLAGTPQKSVVPCTKYALEVDHE